MSKKEKDKIKIWLKSLRDGKIDHMDFIVLVEKLTFNK